MHTHFHYTQSFQKRSLRPVCTITSMASPDFPAEAACIQSSGACRFTARAQCKELPTRSHLLLKSRYFQKAPGKPHSSQLCLQG